MKSTYDVIIIGSGPNGLAAAVHLARADRSVLVVEAMSTLGGGARTSEITLPGYHHDVCSAVHPLAVASPFLASLPLEDFGLVWIHPPSPLAHPFPNGQAVSLERSVESTAAQLGHDAVSYRKLFEPLVEDWDKLVPHLLGPPARIPPHPLAALRFARSALRTASGLTRSRFRERSARGLFAGLAAHSMLSLHQNASAAVGLVLGMAGHVVGWPFPRSGAGALTTALASYAAILGVDFEVDFPVVSMRDLPRARAYVFDVTPRQLLAIAGSELPERYRRTLSRYRYGPGVFKVDWVLREPIPWTHPGCRRAGTVHVGGELEEIERSESMAAGGHTPDRPFVLVTQPSLFDDSRAPRDRHTAWAYCHVPHGSPVDMTRRIEAQIKRFAPGFPDVILSRHTMDTAGLERYNPNYVGGDINGGSAELRQVFARPVFGRNPYATPNPRIFLCSASTPPGGGVHGMCGYHAAKTVLSRIFR
jgi:phytoene dehydrogenase-like protein